MLLTTWSDSKSSFLVQRLLRSVSQRRWVAHTVAQRRKHHESDQVHQTNSKKKICASTFICLRGILGWNQSVPSANKSTNIQEDLLSKWNYYRPPRKSFASWVCRDLAISCLRHIARNIRVFRKVVATWWGLIKIQRGAGRYNGRRCHRRPRKSLRGKGRGSSSHCRRRCCNRRSQFDCNWHLKGNRYPKHPPKTRMSTRQRGEHGGREKSGLEVPRASVSSCSHCTRTLPSCGTTTVIAPILRFCKKGQTSFRGWLLRPKLTDNWCCKT